MTTTTNLPTKDSFGNRLYYKLGIYVSKNGKYLYKDNGSYGKYYYTRKTDSNGEPYITVGGDRHGVAVLVASCFKPAPCDGKPYRISHIDGNKDNCDVNNLQWIPYVPKPYTFNNNPKTKIGDLTVHSNGDVYQNGKKLIQGDYSYDPDMDLHVCISPFVFAIKKGSIHYDKKDMDELMSIAHYVQGTPDGMKNPVILHRDHDKDNYDSDNLEWVEMDSPEYAAYRKDEVAQMQKRNNDMNPKGFPDFRQPKP